MYVCTRIRDSGLEMFVSLSLERLVAIEKCALSREIT